MIKIQKYDEVEQEFFATRAFGNSNEVVNSVLEEVQKRGDAAAFIKHYKVVISINCLIIGVFLHKNDYNK